jgi:ankyrin repeat protein
VNDRSSDGASVLLVATVRGHAAVAEFLLARGADPNADDQGFAPLHWVAGRWETLVTYSYPDASGEWGALLTVPERRLELIKTLLAYGADPNARMRTRPPRFGTSFTRVPTPGATPFLIAAVTADVEVMRLLLASGADPTIAAYDGVTPLMVAAGYGRDGETKLTEADSLAGVRLLMDLGADLNAVTATGDTAMHAVALRGYDEILKVLVTGGASLSPKNRKGETPLRIARGGTVVSQMVQRGTPSTAALLATLGAQE